jgi:hypothetical protein
MAIDWLVPWRPILGSAVGFEAELSRELAPTHPLFGLKVRALGRRGDTDDVLFELLDGTGRVAVVHLTWRGRVEEDSRWPNTIVYASLQDWFDRRLRAEDEDDFAGAAG